ncbi:MAG: phosphoenolpyruvate--protein phosphotransferase [Elusimicrobia bacterium]|nr:phosphoenolpyruvate--protein phosphotransferase [Elusimicrobiota bacterium]
MDQDIAIQGVGASPGIAFGRAFVVEDESMVITKRRVEPKKIRREVKRYLKAIDKTHRDLNATQNTVLKTLGKQHARLIEAHRLILQDPILIKDVPKIIEKDEVNAEFALSEVLSRVNAAFEALTDEFFRERRHDLFDVGRRVLGHLKKKSEKSPAAPKGASGKESYVIVARNLLPSDTLHLKERNISGFVTEMGSRQSHAAILAQSLGIPAVVGVPEILKKVSTGDEIIVDGYEGTVHLRPSVVTSKQFKEKQAKLNKEQEELLALAQSPAVTSDGLAVSILANIDTMDELSLIKKFGGSGVGLFRTELVLLESAGDLLSNPAKQADLYRRALETAKPDPVIIRLLDIGADKLLELGPDAIASTRGVLSKNPADSSAARTEEPLPMGLRGIRLSLRYPMILKNQLRAILMASPSGYPKILIPMVSAIEEVREVRWVLEEIKEEFKRDSVPFRQDIQLGIMIEVPSVAVRPDIFLAEVDFVSVGTNDLVQYALACDRTSAELAYLYQEYHPSILQLLANIAKTAHERKRWVGICGEMAGNSLALPILIGMGFDAISVNPHLIPKIKKQLRFLSLADSQRITEQALRLSSYEEVIELLKREIPLPQ